ncbi:P2Y purinoceptor 14-like [Neolamprologus brichardi]|uniref:P2Y purinoceptor 14-like n=1 Tax=Neolamprologus brichardi TaxID=32507 RepID=UPI001643CD68|nr:P2Y purinoceptor 14-like [Neolamprologus brichardi]
MAALTFDASGNNNSNSSCYEDIQDTSAHIFFMVIYTLVFLVGLFLNGFTLNVYFFRGQRHVSSVTIFLKNLAAADFLISLCLPLRIMKYANIKSEIIRKVYCNFGASAFYLNMYPGVQKYNPNLILGRAVLTRWMTSDPVRLSEPIQRCIRVTEVAADTVESAGWENMSPHWMNMLSFGFRRYLKIVHPLGNHMLQKVRGAKITSILTWVFLITVTSSYILVSLTTEKPGNETLTKVSCDEMHSKELNVLYKIIHVFSATIFVTVLVCLVFFYYKTSRKLSAAQEKQPASIGSKKLARSRRNMLVLVSVFCVCFVPYHLVRLPYTLAQTKLITDCETKKRLFLGKESTLLLSVLHLCFDPLIFFYLNAPFRHTIRKLFPCLGNHAIRDAKEEAAEEMMQPATSAQQEAAC